MGRRSLAEELLEKAEQYEEIKGIWLVIYDFKGVKPSPRFWGNLKRLMRLIGDGSMVQYSVFRTGSRRGAVVALMLAEHYGAQVLTFLGEESDPRTVQDTRCLAT